jgi:hypothetical protein
MEKDVTLNDLEQISKMLGVVEFYNQKNFRNNLNYEGLLIQRIKEYLFDEKDCSVQEYFKKANKCVNLELYAAAKMYINEGIIKSFSNLEQITIIKPLALKIYEKNELNPEQTFESLLNLVGKISIIDF